jgi:hypothetical protein
LGPWPVRPEDVSTRTELIRAFDYLALLRLGPAARSWHHRAVARQWAALSEASQAPAETLAGLYETARYTDGPEALTDAERERARQALLTLAAGATA